MTDSSNSSVGIRAQGRTTILKANYRNTREILDFAYTFACQYLSPQDADDDHIPLIEPMAAGSSGLMPVVKKFESLDQEIGYALRCLQRWHEQGVPWSDMAILYTAARQGERIDACLKAAQVPSLWMATKPQKAAYSTVRNEVPLLTIHSSKGLEFPRVIIVGVGQLDNAETQLPQAARLLYVGMTRAMECLLVTTSKENELSRKLLAASPEG